MGGKLRPDRLAGKSLVLTVENIGLFVFDKPNPAIQKCGALDVGFGPVLTSVSVCTPPRGFWTREGCLRDLGPSYQRYRTPHGLGRVGKAGPGGSLVPGPEPRGGRWVWGIGADRADFAAMVLHD